MEYSISRAKRNMIILSSSFLILYFLIVGLFFFIMGPTKLDPLQSGIQKMLYMIPLGYLLLVFIDYFRYYHLKVLQMSTIAILTGEIITMVIQFANGLIATVPEFVLYTVTAIWMIATIIWMIFLFMANMNDYPAILSIRKYAVGPILIFLIGFSIPFLVKPDSNFAALQILCMICAIPYIFIIEFAIKLQLKE